jgi:hypothetical protein
MPPLYQFVPAPEIFVERRNNDVSDWRSLRLTIQDALDLYMEPLHLVLENARHDFAFVRYLCLPDDGQLLTRLEEAPGRVQIHGGGAGEAKKWLEELLREPPSPVMWRRVLRTWVLFDQDAGDSDATHPSKSAQEMIKVCERVSAAYGGAGVSWSCLGRREIESYTPDRGLREIAGSVRAALADKIVSWRASTAHGGAVDRRHFAWAFDLKKGLTGDRLASETKGREEIKPHDLKAPFNSLSDAEVQSLMQGLGKRFLNDALGSDPAPRWLSEVPDEYDRGPAHQAPRHSLVRSLLDRI